MFKLLNGYENIDYNIFFEIKESKITRGHNYKLVKKQSRLDVRKYSFPQRTINVWNNLSTDCVHASSVNMFKNKIDKYLVKTVYTKYKGKVPYFNIRVYSRYSSSFLVYCHLRCSLDGNLVKTCQIIKYLKGLGKCCTAVKSRYTSPFQTHTPRVICHSTCIIFSL